MFTRNYSSNPYKLKLRNVLTSHCCSITAVLPQARHSARQLEMKPAAVAVKMSRLCMSCTRTQIGPLSFVSSFQQLRTTRKYSTAYSIGINRTDAPRFDSCKTKRYSSTWNSQKPSDLDNMTPIDREKALFKIKRRMGAAHSKGTARKILWPQLQLTMARLLFS
jgi:hypothetical protein